MVVLGDVSGKGIPAAVVTSFVRLHRAIAGHAPTGDPADLLARPGPGDADDGTEHYCTVVAVRLDRVDGRWELASPWPGIPPALVRRPDGRTYELGIPGTPVGLMSEPEFHTVRHGSGTRP